MKTCPHCGKRTYSSREHAKRAHRAARFTIKVYWCPEGQGWHVANRGKT